MSHIMIDLETLDTKSTAVVLSIGAVAFDAYSNTLGEPFYKVFVSDLQAQINKGRTVGADSLLWWMEQDESAREVFRTNEVFIPTLRILDEFDAFVNRNKDYGLEIWGNGAAFDNVILRSLYESFRCDPPWKFYEDRCYRTIKGLKRNVVAEPHGTKHNALDDAITQARHLQRIMQCP